MKEQIFKSKWMRKQEQVFQSNWIKEREKKYNKILYNIKVFILAPHTQISFQSMSDKRIILNCFKHLEWGQRKIS